MAVVAGGAVMLVRVLVVAWALAAAVVGVVRARVRRPRRVPVPVVPPAAPAAPPGRAVRVGRGVLIGFGVVLLLVAAWLEVTVARPAQLPGLLLWLAAAVVLHDGVLSPLVLAADLAARRAGRRLPPLALVAGQVAVAVGVVLTFVTIPAIRSKQIGTANPSVLPLDYGLGLALVWAALVVAAVIVVAVSLRRRART